MDKQIEILLHSYQNIKSVNLDINEKLEIKNNLIDINEFNVRDNANSTEIFDNERNENQIYRIYGRIEYVSLLNALKLNYHYFEDFFSPQTGSCKNIFNSFDFYLVRPAPSGFTKIIGNNTDYIRYFEVIATPNEFDLFKMGFATNVYNEQLYAFSFNIDFDVSNYFDNFNFPLTELFLYVQYKKTSTLPFPYELFWRTIWSDSGETGVSDVSATTLKIGDWVKTSYDEYIGDIIEYIESEFYQTQKIPQTFYILTPYELSGETKTIRWKYNPFIPLRIRYLTDSLYQANTGSTSYDLVQSIATYATKYPNNTNNYIWRNIMPEGYSDPITGIGTNNPFVNGKRYLFTSIILDIVPDLTDENTYNAFEEVWFENNATISDITPNSNVENIGQPC